MSREEASARSAPAVPSPERAPLAEARPPEPLLAGYGEEVVVAGNRPFLLDDPQALWLVDQGKVEIFAVGVQQGRPAGARVHYLTAEPGQAFFGMDLERFGIGAGFLAAGRDGTRLRRLPREELETLARQAKHRDGIATLVDAWTSALSRSLTRDVGPGPLVDVGLLAGQESSLDQGQRARASKEVLWLDVERGNLLFIGMEEIRFDGERLFPLTQASWVEAANEYGMQTSLVGRSTGEVLELKALWAGLDAFHLTVCQCEFINKKLALVDQLNRLRSRSQHNEAAEEAGYRSLAGVLDPAAREIEALGGEADEDAVLRTLKRVGESQGIAIQDHPEAREDLSYEERVLAVTKASGVRTRKVALRGDWWCLDQGPILGRVEASGVPVALIPRGATAYDCVDLVHGVKVPVGEDLAATLAGFGHVLYRPFPAGPVTVRKLLAFGAFGLRRDLLTLLVMGVVLGILGTLTPFFIGRIFDSAIPEAERPVLYQFVLGLGVAAFASAAFRLTQAIAVLRIEGKMDYSIQAALWDRLLDLPSTFFRRYEAGDLADRAAGINAIRGLVSGAGVAAGLGAFSSIFYVALMAWYSSRLAATAMALTALLVSFTLVANLLQLRYQRLEFEHRGRITGLVLQLITGVSRLRVSGAENHAFRVWAQLFADQRRLRFRVGKIQNTVTVFNGAFPIFTNVVIFAVLASINAEARALGAAPPLTTGDFIAFSAAFGLFLAAMQALSDASLELIRAVPTYERLQPILLEPAEIDESKAYPGSLRGEIELSHLHFRYQEDGPWVIKDLSLVIQPGEFVAFVGASGSGKSTLMRLMLGFETPEKGSIYYDGQDLGNLDLRELRQQMGVVLQESKVLPADIYGNIVGSTSRTVDQAWEAARMAGLEADIQEMPMGMHTYVSEGGGGLSGGQRQRLLIARALVNKPRVIFMDEATSALDNRTQSIVTESLDQLQATRIVIAHRLSTIVNAHRICYLEGGAIRESGTYDELMEQNGAFAELARRQMA